MTKGAVMLAMSNPDIDYVSMAAWNAKRVKRFLGLPTTLITDQPILSDDFDQVITITADSMSNRRYLGDFGGTVPWNNSNRCDVCDLTPYDRTLLLDTDYVVNSDQLKCMIQHTSDFLTHRLAMDVATGQILDRLNVFGNPAMPMWWATVVIFTRTDRVRQIFDCWRMVQNHWQHYLDLYHIDHRTFRNDFAMSIAMNIVSGHTLRATDIPWAMPTVLPDVTLESTEHDHVFSIKYLDSRGTPRRQILQQQDFHAMGKRDLGDIIARST